ncbi:MAG: glucose-6-phosphate isomerase [Rhodothermales bacterium]|nr:glucose-6-phosphate isomerase [Rhodothermales bacterium]
MLALDRSRATPFLAADARQKLQPRLDAAHDAVLNGTGVGSDMLGWRRMLLEPDRAVLDEVGTVAAEIRERADVLLCIGIGGSYLGAQAVIEALRPYFSAGAGPKPEVLFAGHHLSPAYHRQLLDHLDGKSVYVNVISKSGTTLEPALAFRFVRRWMEERFDDADRRIVVTTDPEQGALNAMRAEKGYRRFVIPAGVGGRFSVLTPVGLLPIAAAGYDVRALFDAAAEATARLEKAESNAALDYAADRYLFHEQGFTTEILAVFEPKLKGFGGWWQQLFGESEGKEEKGLFPAVVQYTTDLHSLGQYVQQGQRTLVETFLLVEDAGEGLVVEATPANADGLNYLAGKPYAEVNRNAYAGTAEAHAEGGVPNWTITLERLDERGLGQAIAFFEHAVAVSGYLLGVNPFDQPGVEAYKQKMFNLLGRPA